MTAMSLNEHELYDEISLMQLRGIYWMTCRIPHRTFYWNAQGMWKKALKNIQNTSHARSRPMASVIYHLCQRTISEICLTVYVNQTRFIFKQG